jgi:uncharacterized membrane protein
LFAGSSPRTVEERLASVRGFVTINQDLTLVFGAGYGVMLLWLAFTNHRSAERSRARVARQAAAIAGALAAAVLLVAGFWVVYAAG